MREWALAGAVGASPEVDTRRRNAAAEALAKATIQADAARAALAELAGADPGAATELAAGTTCVANLPAPS